MHVFIDTNIFLRFFQYSKDDLGKLKDVFAHHEQGSARVHLTQQVRDEFSRNREAKISDSLKRFERQGSVLQLPNFMRPYSEFDEIVKLSRDLQEKIKSIEALTKSDIRDHKLLADNVIGEIFDATQAVQIDSETLTQASSRVAIGNPPGKPGSLGDAINWLLLLKHVPDQSDLHIVSEDGDFYSVLYEDAPHPFLYSEWQCRKSSKLYVYRTLTKFMNERFDGIAFSFDSKKEELIGRLRKSGSFAATHSLIAELEAYIYFSIDEVIMILQAAIDNGQFGHVVADWDVADFIFRVAVPRIESIPDEFHEVLRTVIDERSKRSN